MRKDRAVFSREEEYRRDVYNSALKQVRMLGYQHKPQLPDFKDCSFLLLYAFGDDGYCVVNTIWELERAVLDHVKCLPDKPKTYYVYLVKGMVSIGLGCYESRYTSHRWIQRHGTVYEWDFALGLGDVMRERASMSD